MILSGQDRRSGVRKTCPSGTQSIANDKWTILRYNLLLCRGKPESIHLNTGTDILTFKRRKVICCIEGISPYRAVNTFHHGYKNQSLLMYTAKVAVFSEIRTKHSTQSEHRVEFLNVKPGGT
jgi:hypothetical protein